MVDIPRVGDWVEFTEDHYAKHADKYGFVRGAVVRQVILDHVVNDSVLYFEGQKYGAFLRDIATGGPSPW